MVVWGGVGEDRHTETSNNRGEKVVIMGQRQPHHSKLRRGLREGEREVL